jgi:hypothetical protein
MKKIYLGTILFIATLSSHAEELPVFNGINFSGEYVCTGKNESVGDYEVFVTLKLNYMNSHGNFGVYDFNTETTNKVIYFGHAIANGYRLATTFKLSNSRNVEYSSGIGVFKKVGKKLWAFNNTYYEPDDTGGNFGSENCAMKHPNKTQEKKPKDYIETR